MVECACGSVGGGHAFGEAAGTSRPVGQLAEGPGVGVLVSCGCIIASGLEQCITAGEGGNTLDRARLEKLFLSLA